MSAGDTSSNRRAKVKASKFQTDPVPNFLTKVLAVHDPMSFTVDNAPIFKALKHFEYDLPRGYTAAEQYLEFARLMKDFRIESSAQNSFYVDAFFYDFWERNIKNANEG